MSTRKLINTLAQLLYQARKLARTISKSFVNWLLRTLFSLGRQPLFANRGFILPTTILLVLIVSLTIGAITFRSYTRTSETITERQQRVVYNAATPAIDRAKAKLEFLFNNRRDTRLPSGVPSENDLVAMMLNTGNPYEGVEQPAITLANGESPYDFPDETRLDIDGDGANDNAWYFPVDLNGDNIGPDAYVAYSILFQTPAEGVVGETSMDDTTDAAIAARADALQVRHGPLSSNTTLNDQCAAAGGSGIEDGWFEDGSNATVVRKNFQVNAFVIPVDSTGSLDALRSAVSTLEFQQDRKITRGNKWGAWFRNDLEIFPGPQFNWNGAMHTEGNLIVGNNSFDAYLISAPASCLYTKTASEITVAQVESNAELSIPEFLGQMISGKVGSNAFENENVFHLYVEGGNPIIAGNDTLFNKNTDSAVNSGPGPADYALDPVKLLTLDISQSRNAPNPGARDGGWADGKFTEYGRILNPETPVARPYVDDAYRADDRYGPTPRVSGIPIPDKIGEKIEGNKLADQGVTDDQLIRNAPETGGSADSVGLDGYWERRADLQGLKLIVGQRLELGNAMGWGGVTNASGAVNWANLVNAAYNEPLRPWQFCTTNNANRCHEARQRRALRDNLAAVQSMAIYHFADPNSGDLPTACMALTVHPGTNETLSKAATFENLDIGDWIDNGSYPLVISDFFHGRGTNGWQFEAPSDPDVFSADTPLMKALTNLAYYAGDPNGGAPSFTPVQDNVVHPYPSMAMWGDFSILRRILDGGTPYTSLSPADKATLHTAACTMGMLAYNIDYLNKVTYDTNNATGDMARLATYLNALQLGKTTGLPTGSLTIPTAIANRIPVSATTIVPGINRAFDPAISTPDNYIAGLKLWRENARAAGVNVTEMDRIIALAELVSNKEQVERDRIYGFQSNAADNVGGNFRSLWCKGSQPLKPTELPALIASSAVWTGLRNLCTAYPKYPLLSALFPTADRTETTFPYMRDYEDRASGYVSYMQTQNNGLTYKWLNPDEIGQIALKPLAFNNWVLPTQPAGTGKTPNHSTEVRIKRCETATAPCGDTTVTATLNRIPFKDSALMNGREMMAVRVLDIDLGLLRSSAYQNNYWLPAVDNAGVVYAFREDAVREGGITRPTNGVTWATCSNDISLQNNANCRMRAGVQDAYLSTDPPLNSANLISPKPVDYVADPDRRPYGFRLRNGSILRRPSDNISLKIAGMTFVTDNPVYIQGDFNLHKVAGGNQRLEEFTQLLNADTFGNFYDRTNLDVRFARPDTDDWRPAEILSDAITVISDNFCDGSIEDGFLRTNFNLSSTWYGCSGHGDRTSFLNQNYNSVDPTAPTATTIPVNLRPSFWLREDPFSCQLDRADRRCQGSPIMMSRNGNPVVASDTLSGTPPTQPDYGDINNNQTYIAFSAGKSTIVDKETRVNAIIVSGLVPSRPRQSYGGLHNFPRFISNWGGKNLFISGSLIQLTFSNSATAPFDQSAWEPGSTPSGELINYYSPPNRRWGYDVGLQYAPAGPLASRFIQTEPTRDEFYSEPPADDPYIVNLCEGLQSAVPGLGGLDCT
jgi:hypothetical protein